MTGIRTDLAQEAHQLHRDVEGVECRDETCHGYEAHVVQVRTHEAAQVLGKPIGTYVTVELDGLLRREEAGFSRAVEAIAGLLAPMLPTKSPGCWPPCFQLRGWPWWWGWAIGP